MNMRYPLMLLALLLIPPASAAPPLQLLTFNSPPLVHAESDQRPDGITIALIQRMFELAEVDYSLQAHPAQRAYIAAIGKANTCVFPIERSQEREPNLTWLGPVAISRHALYSNPSRPLGLVTLEDARPYQIATYIGSGVGEYLSSLGFDVYLTRDNAQGLQMLHHDRTRLWLADIRSAPVIAEQLGLAIASPELVFFTTLRYMGCNLDTDPAILDKLQQALVTMHKRDEVRRVLELEDL